MLDKQGNWKKKLLKKTTTIFKNQKVNNFGGKVWAPECPA